MAAPEQLHTWADEYAACSQAGQVAVWSLPWQQVLVGSLTAHPGSLG